MYLTQCEARLGHCLYNRWIMQRPGPIGIRTIFLTLTLVLVPRAGDWTTFAHDPQRPGWAFEETTLSPENVSHLELKWKSRLKNAAYQLSALTAPIVVSNISTARGVRSLVYVAGITGTVFALDAQNG
jgi:hypothetical protein